MKKLSKGFTLIELLVVIAIIGILATIVLTSLGRAKTKALDSKAEDQISSMRAQAEIFYTAHHDYGTPATTPDCTTGTLFVAGDPDSLSKLIDGRPAEYPALCRTSGAPTANAWAVAIQVSDGAWCADSTGQVSLLGAFSLDASGTCHI